MTASREELDAYHYWRQFPVTVHFQDPAMDPIIGMVLDLGATRSRDEVLPRMRLQTKDGQVLVVVVSQTRLLAELNRLRPAKGDWVKITYNGEATKAAPGMNPTKEFTVEVRRAGSQSPGRHPGESSGEAAGENDPETGK